MLVERIPCGLQVAEGGIAAVGDAGAYAVAVHPAMLSLQQRRLVIDTGSRWHFGGSGVVYAAVAVRERGERLVAGIGTTWFDSGVFDVTDWEGRPTGETARYTATALSVGVGFSLIRNVHLGAGVYSVTEQPWSGRYVGARVGVVYSRAVCTAVLQGYRVGAAVHGLGLTDGAAYEFGCGADVVRVGWLSIGLGLSGNSREPARCSIGYRRMLVGDEQQCRFFGVQAGVDGINLLGVGGAPSVGFLAGYRNIVVGYAALVHIPLGFVHQLSGGVRW